MSPLKINLLLRLAVYVHPFEDMAPRRVHAPAMLQAFRDFAEQGLLVEGVTHMSVATEPRPVVGSEWVQRLSAKGERLRRALESIEPEDV